MTPLLNDPAVLWLAVGALLIIVEALTVPGLGLFLAGLGALCTGLLIEAELLAPGTLLAQFASFFGLTVLWTLLLWKPLKKFRTGHTLVAPLAVNNIVGETATLIGEGLRRGVPGQAKWSGTIMNAEMDASCRPDYLPAGTLVTVAAVSGTTLKVVPK